jgi:hypothetical protein
MIDLRPLIHRFVDDVLQAIQDASVDELRELVGAAEGERRPGPGRARKSGPQPARRAASRRRGRPRLRAGMPAVSAARAHEARATVADITDPEALLAAAAAEARAKAKAPHPSHTASKPLELVPSLAAAQPATAHVVAAPSEPPPPPSGPKLVLRPDESLARASDHGVVIRRRKRVAP